MSMLGLLHASGTKILNVNNEEVIWNGVTSRGICALWQGSILNFLDDADVKLIRNYGMNVARADICLDMAVYNIPANTMTPTSINYRAGWWEQIDRIVNAGEKYGLWIEFNFAPYIWANRFGGSGFPDWMYDGTWSYGVNYPATQAGTATAIREFFNTANPAQNNIRQMYITFWKDFAARYKDRPYVVFSLFNEPLNTAGTGGSIDFWNEGEKTVNEFAVMYRDFMERTIDEIRTMDNGVHMIIVNEAYFWYWNQNLQVRRPNIVIENHLYGNTVTADTQLEYANYAWRFNQPFVFGEFGGIQEGLTDLAHSQAFIQNCYGLVKSGGYPQPVGWMYLRYNNDPYSGAGVEPNSEIWSMLQANLYPNIKYPQAITAQTFTLAVSATITGVQFAIDGQQYTTPTMTMLTKGSHIIIVPTNVQSGDIYNFVKWEDGSTNPTRTINLTSDMTILASYELPAPPPPAKGHLSIHTFSDSNEVTASYKVLGTSLTGSTPDIVELDVGSYEIEATYDTQIKTATATVLEGQTIRVDLQFIVIQPPAPTQDIGLVLFIGLLFVMIAFLGGKK